MAKNPCMMTGGIDPGLAFGLIGLVLMTLVLSGCNTVEGMGQDVSAVGGAVSDTADNVEDEM
jgi:predicted small secreted protein